MGTAGGSLTLLARRRPLTGLSPTPPLPGPRPSPPRALLSAGGRLWRCLPASSSAGGLQAASPSGPPVLRDRALLPAGPEEKEEEEEDGPGELPRRGRVSPPLLLGLLRGSPGIRWAMGSFVLVQAGRPVALLGRR